MYLSYNLNISDYLMICLKVLTEQQLANSAGLVLQCWLKHGCQNIKGKYGIVCCMKIIELQKSLISLVYIDLTGPSLIEDA